MGLCSDIQACYSLRMTQTGKDFAKWFALIVLGWAILSLDWFVIDNPLLGAATNAVAIVVFMRAFAYTTWWQLQRTRKEG